MSTYKPRISTKGRGAKKFLDGQGEVTVLGHSMPEEQIVAKWDIGFSSEDLRLYEAMTLEWHMGFIRSIYSAWEAEYAKVLLKRFGLRAEQKMKGFSHGQRVKAALLLVLARRPRLLVLDEPTTGLDPVERHEILRELTAAVAEEASILFSSHNTQDVEQRIRSHLSTAAVTAIPGAVFSPALDGHIRAYSTHNGRVIWDFDTACEFPTVNGKPAHGGSIDATGAAIAGGLLIITSGYNQFGGMPGNALLVFSVNGQ